MTTDKMQPDANSPPEPTLPRQAKAAEPDDRQQQPGSDSKPDAARQKRGTVAGRRPLFGN